MRYKLSQTSCGCDDLYLITAPNGKIIRVIVFWDDAPEWMERATRKAERICRWLNRRPPFRVRLNRLIRKFDPTGNQKTWGSFGDVANYLDGRSDDDAFEATTDGELASNHNLPADVRAFDDVA